MKEKVSIDKQNIKSQRVKTYFIQAAKSIIINEGVEHISVRKVADLAGYTFTTIYNHFTDLNALLLDVKTVMIQDLIKHMQDLPYNTIYDLDDIKKQNRHYIEYFIKRPNIFHFFYSYRIHPTDEKAIMPDFSSNYMDTYRSLVSSGIIKEADVPIIARTIIYTLHGLLALYFSDNGMTVEILYDELNRTTEYIIKGGNKT